MHKHSSTGAGNHVHGRPVALNDCLVRSSRGGLHLAMPMMPLHRGQDPDLHPSILRWLALPFNVRFSNLAIFHALVQMPCASSYVLQATYICLSSGAEPRASAYSSDPRGSHQPHPFCGSRPPPTHTSHRRRSNSPPRFALF